ncbi:N-acetyltransferase [Deinococcus peraridilitoris]|uniref:Acetyltransferase, N-acetylglutamate synthase n=1 Tax=Deinococcus peraridilitoris (strain DSM 19664 / LMG 22246 / CIP 109416 / KR-200) TaxID=937777 RepID=L0A5C8_DEIPD|nr:N-acetyltransferase [Deinococcus peraridilitoris]AFZ68387.1 acetyltransferase, N-acetylglutamate synthase [Deinococcus peraridilitoris DSM 19664]
MTYLALDSIAIPDLSPQARVSARKARLSDLEAIHELIGYWAARGQMLVRSRQLLAETIRDFVVMEAEPEGDHPGGLAGVCGLHMLAPDLAEVRGLAVHPSFQGRGLGRELVLACEREARELGLPALFAWTYQQKFFENCGFMRIDKTHLHPKVWSECQRCAFFENCNEIAMLKTLQGPGASRTA